MKRLILILIICANFQTVTAQYTEIINSKRPGFSESPYSIGTDVFQFETGLFYKNNNDSDLLAHPKAYGGELFFRYGKFLEKLEFDAKITYQSNEVKNPFGANYYNHGISELTLGAKYLIYQQEYTDKSKEVRSWKRRLAFDKKRLIPSVGVYAGVNTNFLGEHYKDDGISYKGAILLQNDFSDRLILITNLVADKITADDSNYSYILTMTYAMSEKWSYFIENQGVFSKTEDTKFNFGTGLAYLFSDNLQIDASVRTNFFEDYSFLYSSVGVAWRLDRHSDELVNKNSPLNQLNKKRKKRGNFFSRLLKKN